MARNLTFPLSGSLWRIQPEGCDNFPHKKVGLEFIKTFTYFHFALFVLKHNLVLGKAVQKKCPKKWKKCILEFERNKRFEEPPSPWTYIYKSLKCIQFWYCWTPPYACKMITGSLEYYINHTSVIYVPILPISHPYLAYVIISISRPYLSHLKFGKKTDNLDPPPSSLSSLNFELWTFWCS